MSESKTETENDLELLAQQIELFDERGWDAAAEAKRDRFAALTGERDVSKVDTTVGLSNVDVQSDVSDAALGLEPDRIEQQIERARRKIRQRKSSSFTDGSLPELEAELSRLKGMRSDA